MGFKRPFDNEELHELPFKNPRQFDYGNKLTRFDDTFPFDNVPQKPHISVGVEGGFHKFQFDEAVEKNALSDVTHLVDKDFEISAPLSLVTSSSSDEDTGSGAVAISPVFPEYPDFDFPRRMLPPIEDVYSLLLDRSPRKQVTLGPNHQANVLSWSRQIKKDKFAQNGVSDTDNIDDEERMTGTCVIPMPDSELFANDSCEVGAGRADCSCLDRGSFRCVQQHVIEARKRLQKSLGHEKFVKLGLYEMGEDVAYKWSEEEEEIFREVVCTNPASLGKDFWKQLSVVFPSRSKRELVSYYFNVFILQRRAVQNRSSVLDIDSDDDEWQGSELSYEVKASDEDEGSAIESLVDRADIANHEGEFYEEEEEDDDDDNNEDDDDSGNFDCHRYLGDHRSAATREDYGVNLSVKGHVAKSFDESGFSLVFEQTKKVPGIEEDFNAQDDSCLSFEFQPNVVDSHSLIDTKTNTHVIGMKTDLNKCMSGRVDGTSELMMHPYLLDTGDAKIWDTRYPPASMKGIDLQPTCNVIEEIFGQDAWGK